MICVEMLEIMYFDQDVEIEEIARAALRDHLQFVDIGARIADHLGDLRQGADLIVDLDAGCGPGNAGLPPSCPRSGRSSGRARCRSSSRARAKIG